MGLLERIRESRAVKIAAVVTAPIFAESAMPSDNGIDARVAELCQIVKEWGMHFEANKYDEGAPESFFTFVRIDGTSEGYIVRFVNQNTDGDSTSIVNEGDRFDLVYTTDINDYKADLKKAFYDTDLKGKADSIMARIKNIEMSNPEDDYDAHLDNVLKWARKMAKDYRMKVNDYPTLDVKKTNHVPKSPPYLPRRSI